MSDGNDVDSNVEDLNPLTSDPILKPKQLAMESELQDGTKLTLKPKKQPASSAVETSVAETNTPTVTVVSTKSQTSEVMPDIHKELEKELQIFRQSMDTNFATALQKNLGPSVEALQTTTKEFRDVVSQLSGMMQKMVDNMNRYQRKFNYVNGNSQRGL